MSKTFFEKFIEVQQQLKAPKGQRNNFGKYNYRSCEDIVEAVKPLLHERSLYLVIDDELVSVGDRFYIKAIATVTDGEKVQQAAGWAREALDKKGMDESQITGATSSYARKYALNGLFAIDDTKDADSDEHKQTYQRQNEKPVQNKNAAKDKYETALPKVVEAVKAGGLQSMAQDKLAFIEEMRKARPDLHMKVMEANAQNNAVASETVHN